jgi:hypothetical protein
MGRDLGVGGGWGSIASLPSPPSVSNSLDQRRSCAFCELSASDLFYKMHQGITITVVVIIIDSVSISYLHHHHC